MADVWLIEDDKDLALGLMRLFQLDGIIIEWFQNPEAAWEALEERTESHTQPKVTISDYDFGVMSSVDGVYNIKRLKLVAPDAHYLIYSGVERDIPSWAEQITKDRPLELVKWVREKLGWET